MYSIISFKIISSSLRFLLATYDQLAKTLPELKTLQSILSNKSDWKNIYSLVIIGNMIIKNYEDSKKNF